MDMNSLNSINNLNPVILLGYMGSGKTSIGKILAKKYNCEFIDLDKVIEKKYNSSKDDKNILMYCTGGIRCEKASAYLINKGYKNVYQLNGGIIEYARQVKEHNLENKFLGKNFVFDNRRSERISGDIISNCHQCGDKCDEHVNCNNEACHLLFIQCESCAKKYDGCCSIECSEINSLPIEKQKELRRGKKNSNKIFKKGRFKEKPLNKI